MSILVVRWIGTIAFGGIPCRLSVTLKMQAASPLQTMIHIYQIIRRHIPEDSIIVQVLHFETVQAS